MPLSLAEMLEALYGVKSRLRENPLVAAIDTTVTRFLPYNPMRLSFTAVNLSPNSIFIGPTNLVDTDHGIFLGPSGGAIVIQWDRDFEQCASEWFAIASVDASDFYVLENLSQ